MTAIDRVCLYGLLCFVLVMVYRSGARPSAGSDVVKVVTVTNTYERVTSAAASSVGFPEMEKKLTVEYLPYVYGCDGVQGGLLREFVFANGRKYIKGQKHPDGLVVEVSRDFVRIVGCNGNEKYIYPLSVEHLYKGNLNMLKKFDDFSEKDLTN